MEIFTFSVVNLTNIWAGVGARRWAVSKRKPRTNRSKVRQKGSKSDHWGSFTALQANASQRLSLFRPHRDRAKSSQMYGPNSGHCHSGFCRLGPQKSSYRYCHSRPSFPVLATAKSGIRFSTSLRSLFLHRHNLHPKTGQYWLGNWPAASASKETQPRLATISAPPGSED